MTAIDLGKTNILVIGAGIMGIGIAQVAAQADQQWQVSKEAHGGKTLSRIQLNPLSLRMVKMSFCWPWSENRVP